MIGGNQLAFAETPEVIEPGRRRVLIVDDDLDFAETIADILEPIGYEVRLAHSSAEARKEIANFPASVALLDIRLGSSESGIQLIGELKEIRPGVLCIMMTGFAALETAIQALKDGAYDYLRKPVSPADLFATLGRCFSTVELLEAKNKSDAALQKRNEELANLNQRMRGIVEAARRLAASNTLQELGYMMMEEFTTLMSSHGGSLFLVHEDRLQLLHSVDLDHVPESIPLPVLERSVFWHVFQTRESLLMEDVTRDKGTIRSGWQGYENGSTLVFPILDHTGQIGALLSLHNPQTPPFVRQDQELGMILASLCAEVLRNLRANTALEEEKTRFREMTDMLPAIVYEIDKDERLTFLSRESKSLTGYGGEDISQGLSVADLFVEKDRKHFTDNLERLLAGEEPSNGDYTLAGRGGRQIPVLAHSAPIVRDSKMVGLRGFIFDITERVKAERHRSQLAMAVDQAAELMLILDVDGVLQYINPVYHFLAGIKPTECIGGDFQNILSEDHGEDFFESMWDTLRDGKIWAGRLDTRRADGSSYESEATISPLRNSDGEIVNYVAVLRDISHEALLEKRLRQAEKLEAIGTLAGGIAHDFNNILSPIIGFTEIVREDLEEGSEPHSNLEKVLNACHMARELVRRILTFSRQAEAERKPVDVKQVLKEALKLLRPSIPSTIDIRTDIEGDGSVFADPTQIHQLVMNLSTNAYQAMQELGGILRISLSNLVPNEEILANHPRLQANREHLVLKVSDTGVGMTKATLERIFDPFFSTKEMGKGTGLGLATVHGIVMEMGGDISVTSELGEATEVTIYMPRYDLASKESKRKSPKVPVGGKERILFVDDEEMILQLGEKMLTRLGYRVETAYGSETGLARFEGSPQNYDLIITDQTMPGLTGQELAIKIKKIRADIPIILITGFSSVLDLDRLNKIGISQIVHKPFTRHDIGTAIQMVLHGRNQN